MKKHGLRIILILSVLSVSATTTLSSIAHAAEPSTHNTLLIMDASGSMNRTIGGQFMITSAKMEGAALLENLPGNLGLIAYGHRKDEDCKDIETLVPLAANSSLTIKNKLNELVAKGKTPIAKALEQAGKELKKQNGPKRIILLSDGEESCSGDPIAVAKALRERGMDLQIHVVGFGVSPEVAQQLAAIASSGGGRYFTAKNSAELKAALAEVKGN